MQNDLLEAALGYAAEGLRVFPAAPRGKKPLISGWPSAATTDPDLIRAWWAQWPDANIGVVTGEGRYVLDVDDLASLAALEAEIGQIPRDKVARTGGGGLHIWLAAEGELRNSASKIGPGLDIRADGGFVVMPPSIHESGVQYEWL